MVLFPGIQIMHIGGIFCLPSDLFVKDRKMAGILANKSWISDTLLGMLKRDIINDRWNMLKFLQSPSNKHLDLLNEIGKSLKDAGEQTHT